MKGELLPGVDRFMELSHAIDQEVRRYDILKRLKTPAELFRASGRETYGHGSFSSFMVDMVDHVTQQGVGMWQVAGESISGKSFAISQAAQVLHTFGVVMHYVPWVDVIRAAKVLKLIPLDRPFGQLTPDEFRKVTGLYKELQVQTFASCKEEWEDDQTKLALVIGEAPIYPGKDQNGEYDRGLTAMSELVRTHDSFVSFVVGSGSMRIAGKIVRGKLPSLTSSESADQFFTTNAVIPVGESVAEATRAMQQSGAPVEAVEIQEDQINNAILDLYQEEKYDRGVKIDESSLRTNPWYRARRLALVHVPYLLRSEIRMPDENRSVVVVNTNARTKTRYPLQRYNAVRARYDLRSIP